MCQHGRRSSKKGTTSCFCSRCASASDRYLWHCTLKELVAQRTSVRDAMRGRLSLEECTEKLGGLNMTPAELRNIGRIVLTGCGTALHAGRVGEYLIERLANIPTEVEFASEFR